MLERVWNSECQKPVRVRFFAFANFWHFDIIQYCQSRELAFSKKKSPKTRKTSALKPFRSAGKGTWTLTTLLPQAPEACASANSAIPAQTDKKHNTLFWKKCQEEIEKNFVFFILKKTWRIKRYVVAYRSC